MYIFDLISCNVIGETSVFQWYRSWVAVWGKNHHGKRHSKQRLHVQVHCEAARQRSWVGTGAEAALLPKTSTGQQKVLCAWQRETLHRFVCSVSMLLIFQFNSLTYLAARHAGFFVFFSKFPEHEKSIGTFPHYTNWLVLMHSKEYVKEKWNCIFPAPVEKCCVLI